MNSTSLSLLHRLKQPEEPEAWQRFVDLYAPLIFRWVRQRGITGTETADLVQEVLAVLVKKLPEFQYNPQHRFRSWLKTVTVNKANDYYRQKGKQPANVSNATLNDFEQLHEPDPFEEAEYRSYVAHRALKLMRSEFREEDWQACWQQVVEGRNANEVAQNLGLSVNSVYLAKSRILGRLRTELADLLD